MPNTLFGPAASATTAGPFCRLAAWIALLLVPMLRFLGLYGQDAHSVFLPISGNCILYSMV